MPHLAPARSPAILPVMGPLDERIFFFCTSKWVCAGSELVEALKGCGLWREEVLIIHHKTALQLNRG